MDLLKKRAGAAIGGLLAASAFALSLTGTAAAAAPKPFGHACKAQNQVRFCPTPSSADRVPSFDRVPLDVDVTLPAQGNGPFPTIVMLHGWGGNKGSFETTDTAGDGASSFHYNNVFYARKGYAVVTYSARGFGNSCGGGPSGDHSGPCGKGYVRLADQRYEARDTQHLLGRLVDQRIAKANALGVTGISYGGGQSMELAFLNKKVRKPNGDLVRWRSPKGRPLHIAAAYPRWPWSDLVDALLPNGRFLDTAVAPRAQSMHPIGVPIQSYISGLYAVGQLAGYYCGTAPASTPCMDREANLPRSFAQIQAGQPLSADARRTLRKTYENHGAYALRFVPGHSRPSPLLIQNGWTDDLFPAAHALRPYNHVRSAYRGFPVSLQLADIGHSRGSNKPATSRYLNNQGFRFFNARLRNAAKGPGPGAVTAFTQTCPETRRDAGPFKARTYGTLQGRELTFGTRRAQTFTSAGGNPNVAREFDPIAGTSDACKTIPETNEPNTATYRHRFSEGSLTMMGAPTVRASIDTTGQFGQIDARLWDVFDGEQRLVDRGTYSLRRNQDGRIRFQLHGNGWRFRQGHSAVLQLLGRDTPYYQAGNSPFSVTVSKVRVDMPRLAAAAAR